MAKKFQAGQKSPSRSKDDLDCVPTKQDKPDWNDRVETADKTQIPEYKVKKRPQSSKATPSKNAGSIQKLVQSNKLPPSMPSANRGKKPAEVKKPKEKADVAWLETMKKQEMERAVKLEQEELATKAVLEKMRDNPNSTLHQMANEVALLGQKINPILARVEEATNRVNQARGLSSISRLSD